MVFTKKNIDVEKMKMPVCFVCGKEMRRNAKRYECGTYKKKFIGLGSDPPRDFCSKKHLNKYWKNKEKYEAIK